MFACRVVAYFCVPISPPISRFPSADGTTRRRRAPWLVVMSAVLSIAGILPEMMMRRGQVVVQDSHCRALSICLSPGQYRRLRATKYSWRNSSMCAFDWLHCWQRHVGRGWSLDCPATYACQAHARSLQLTTTRWISTDRHLPSSFRRWLVMMVVVVVGANARGKEPPFNGLPARYPGTRSIHPSNPLSISPFPRIHFAIVANPPRIGKIRPQKAPPLFLALLFPSRPLLSNPSSPLLPPVLNITPPSHLIPSPYHPIPI
ncbi:hypothetical protein IWZ03DRAFT_75178 [Phyllosticta citriasiana]|uniref:Uncharacterized protein n=1 Tax=Phyllosticta citriasiana TaxID=595635 RepID=A0ABR1KAV3_9PEZI